MNILALIWPEEYVNAYSWAIETAFVIFVTLLADYVFRHIAKRSLLRLKKSRKMWDDALVIAIMSPLRVLIWIIGISFIGLIIREGFGTGERSSS